MKLGTDHVSVYNYFRDYDPSIGRYIQSDPTGLVAGPNSYSYVRNNPVSRSDPLGLVEWNGTLTGVSFVGPVGAAIYRFHLVSECENGVRGVAKGWAVGGAAGVGVTLSGSGSSVSFSDFNSTPNPDVFKGDFGYSGAGAALELFEVGQPGVTVTMSSAGAASEQAGK